MNYIERMIDDRRLIVSQGNYYKSIFFISICDDPEPYLDNNIFEYKEHDPYGKICVVEKFAGINIPFSIRKVFSDFLKINYPSVEEVRWIRPNKKGVRLAKVLKNHERVQA